MKSRAFKTFALVAVLALVVPSLPAFAGEAGGHAAKTKTTFAIDGMTCGGCSAKVRLAVKDLDGVNDVKVSHDDNKAEVTYDAEKVSVEKISKAIEKLGFKVKEEKTEKVA